MSTRDVASFSFRGVDDAAASASLDDVRALLRSSEVGALLPPGTIGTQAAGQGAGVPMSAIRRGLLMLYGRNVSSYAVTATAWTEVDSTALAGTIVCTGRPVIVLMALNGGRNTAPTFAVSVSMDGIEITATTDGMGYIDLATAADFNLVNWRVVTPRPGPRRFALVAKVPSGSGIIWSSPDDEVRLAVVEL